MKVVLFSMHGGFAGRATRASHLGRHVLNLVQRALADEAGEPPHR